MKNSDLLNRIHVATPCPASWERMVGNEQVRYCDLCELNVYNFAELTGKEIELLLQSEGRVCGRLYRRADGTLLTKDCPVGVRALRKRVTRRAAAVLTALLSFAGVALPQASSRTTEIEITQGSVTEATITGLVTDQTEALCPGASVVLTNSTTREVVETNTDGEGKFRFNRLQSGTYTLKVSKPGFKTAVVTDVQVKMGELRKLTVALEVGEPMMGAVDFVLSEPITKSTLDILLGKEYLIPKKKN